MSSVGSTARAIPLRLPELPLPGRSGIATRRLLALVPQRRSQAAKTPFAVVVVVLLVGGLLGLLLLNMLVAQGSFALHDLAKQDRALQLREQELGDQVQALQAPSELAARATRLGMVPGGAPAFLRLSDGRVLGQPSAGQARPKPVVNPVAKPVTTAAKPVTPKASTTWTAPRQSPPPKTGTHR